MISPIAPILAIAPSDPSDEAIKQAIGVLAKGGVIAFPTDTLYGIGCEFGQRRAIERIHKIRDIDGAVRPLTFLMPDIGEVAHYATVNEAAYKILNRIFPGPYCAELIASNSVPAGFTFEERRTIGVRIPDTILCEKMLWGLGRPILTATAKTKDGRTLTTALDIQNELGTEIDLIIDGGTLAGPPSTVVSLADDWVTVLREGRGPASKILM